MQDKFRLKKNEDFKELIDRKQFIVNDSFTVYFFKNNLGYSRFGIGVGKKNGNAVERNKLKRQIRMMVSKTFAYNKSIDYLIMVRKGYTKKTFAQNLEELQKINQKIDKRGV
ncbi:MAG: ribonuclease P protein component [Erysipelotrichales bacterium]